MATDLLERACNTALIDSLPASLKASIDSGLAMGMTRGDIVRMTRARAGLDSLLTLAVEAYLDSKGVK